MKSKWMPLIIVAAILVIIVIWISGTYNGMISKSEYVKSKQSDIQSQLQRRADLIPNLVNTVKGYAAHEQSIIQSIADARSKLLGATTTQDALSANDQLTQALRGLTVIVENYPDLKASANYISLQDELSGTENRINVARMDYNKAARDYNSSIKTFPAVIFSNMFGFKEVPYFEPAPGSDKVPEVKF